MTVTVRLEVEHDDGEITVRRQSLFDEVRPGSRERVIAELVGSAVGQILMASASGKPVRIGELVGTVSHEIYKIAGWSYQATPPYGYDPYVTKAPVLRGGEAPADEPTKG